MLPTTINRLPPDTTPAAPRANRVRGSGPIGSADFKHFQAGTHERLYEVLGCQLGASGARFAVWAPQASAVAVVGDFNDWRGDAHPLKRGDHSAIWECEVAGLCSGALYKYRITRADGTVAEQADPLTFYAEAPPGTASRAWRWDYAWADAQWLAQRQSPGDSEAAISIYEMDPDAWRAFPGVDPHGPANDAAHAGAGFRQIARPLADYVRENAFTHIALRRVGEAYAPSARHGAPDDFMFLIDTLHQAGVGVIIDWRPAPGAAGADDPAELAMAHPEMRSCLLSSALFWLDRYHVDGLRFSALAPLLYLDYGRRPGEWRANRYGGKENLEVIDFLRRLNATISRDYPGAITIADDAAAWPMVSRPATMGGLGFGMVRGSAWAQAVLAYFRNDPWFRKFHHEQLTASVAQAFAENLILPLGFDELAGQSAPFEQTPGEAWQRCAGLRSLYGYMWAHPGKKLLRCGAEFGEFAGPAQAGAVSSGAVPAGAIDWSRLNAAGAGGLRRWVGDLNRFYRAQRGLHGLDFDAAGLLWLEANDRENSVLAFLRCARDGSPVLVVCNFTPVLRTSYVVGVPAHELWREALNSEAAIYGGSGAGNFGRAEAMPVPAHGQPMSLALTLPPHGLLFFVPENDVRAKV
jgi:1,4-alpha-glucan branching enzyme